MNQDQEKLRWNDRTEKGTNSKAHFQVSKTAGLVLWEVHYSYYLAYLVCTCVYIDIMYYIHITHTYMLINSHHQWHITKDDQRTWKSQHSQVVGSSLVLPCHLKMLVSTRLYLGPTSQVRSLLPGCLIKIASETFTIPKKRLSSKHSFSRGYVKLRGY